MSVALERVARALQMIEKTPKEGVLGIQVRNRENRWIDLPYVFFFGRDRVVAGGKIIKSFKDRDCAEQEARDTIKRLKAQNPGHTYQIVRAPKGQAESGLVWVPLARDRLDN